MDQLAGRIAAVTGAASGIGRALAFAFAAEGMDVAIADIDDACLDETRHEVARHGVRCVAQRVDVSRSEEVEAFARTVVTELGAVHVVCNNAGVSPVGPLWETSLDEWRWVVDVNLWGVIHGVRAFTPLLVAQNAGHIVNTASIAGLISPPGFGAYSVTKHGVVALSEALLHDLRQRRSAVGVSVLCPAYVPTRLAETARRHAGQSVRDKSQDALATEASFEKAVASGKLSPGDIAQAVVAAVKGSRFYILPHARVKTAIRARLEDILEEREPRNPMSL